MTVKEIARFYKIPVERAFGNTGGYILEDVRRTKADATRRAKALRGDGLTRFARSPAVAKGNIMHYYGDLLPKDRHGRLEPYNEFLIVKVLDNQFSAFCPLK